MNYCIGIDEAGRGPLAGPVTAAAVILTASFPRELLKDSKKLSASARDRLEELIKREASAWAVGWASPQTIDELNIHHAALLAMQRSFDNLRCAEKIHAKVFIDGAYLPRSLPSSAEAVPGGDSRVPEIMAASILAKTARDRWMTEAAKKYPQWGFDIHKGYPTKEHRRLCSLHGISPIHRRSFRITVPSSFSCNQEL